jgi:taurine dioxygenase
MTLTITPLSDLMGAEATGIDLTQPVDDDTKQALDDALHEHIVLCIRDQALDGPAFLEAAKIFGPLMRQANEDLCDPEMPELGFLTSNDTDRHDSKQRVVRGQTWHSDHSFTQRPPKATVLHAVTVPSSGGDTSFCNLRAAYRALPEETKQRIAGLKARHQFRCSRVPKHETFIKLNNEEERLKDYIFDHPIARRHVATGETTLYLNPQRMEEVIGLDRAESDALLDSLAAHADNPDFHWNHKWRKGDLLIWDNRCTMHHANGDWPAGEERFLLRCIVEGEVPV